MEGCRGGWCGREQQQTKNGAMCAWVQILIVVFKVWGCCVCHVGMLECVCDYVCGCVCIRKPAGADTQWDRLCEGSSLHLCHRSLQLHCCSSFNTVCCTSTLSSQDHSQRPFGISLSITAIVPLSIVRLKGKLGLKLPRDRGFGNMEMYLLRLFPLLNSKQSY